MAPPVEGVAVLTILEAYDLRGWRVQPLAGDLDIYCASRLGEVLAEHVTDLRGPQSLGQVTGTARVGEAETMVTSMAGEGAGVVGLVVDLTEVPFVDSAGLGVLARAYRRTRDAGLVLHLVGTNDHLAVVLRDVGLAPLIPTPNDVEAATASAAS